MKITKEQLKQIVREELENIQEQGTGDYWIYRPRNGKGEDCWAYGNTIGSKYEWGTFRARVQFEDFDEATKVAKKLKDIKKYPTFVRNNRGNKQKQVKEAKISSFDKKQFQSDAQEILDNLIKAKLLDDSASMQTAYNSLLSVFSAIVNGPDSANYSKVKKYLPRKLNHDLYDNGEGNSYDSVWMSQNDAQRSTVFKKAIKAKLNLSEESIHEDTDKEYPIWGIPPGKSSEELLYTKATSKRQATSIAKVLTDKHKCKKVRIQVLDLAQDPADIWDAEKLFK